MTREKRVKCLLCGKENDPERKECKNCGSTIIELGEEGLKIFKALKQIPRVGDKKAKKIVESGIDKIDKLKDADIGSFTSVEGIGKKTADQIFSSLNRTEKDGGDLYLCQKCGSFFSSESSTCPNCGEDPSDTTKNLEDDEKNGSLYMCDNCGSFVSSKADRCPRCGFVFDEDRIEEKPTPHDDNFDNIPSDEETTAESNKHEKEDPSFIPDPVEGMILGEDVRVCGNCGSMNNVDVGSCPICGSDFSEDVKVPEEPNIDEGLPEGVISGDREGGVDMCSVCGAFMDPDSERCPICGSVVEATPDLEMEPLEEDEKEEISICEVCGYLVKDSQKRCSICGSDLEKTRVSYSDIKDSSDINKDDFQEITKKMEEKAYEHSVKEVESLRNEIEQFLDRFRSKPISIGLIEEMSNNVKRKLDKGRLDEAYDIGIEAVEMCNNIEKFIHQEELLKKRLISIKKKGLDYQHYIEDIKESRKQIGKGRIKRSLSKQKEILHKLEEKEEDIGNVKKRIKRLSSEIKSILNTSEVIGIDMEEERKKMAESFRKSKSGDLNQSFNLLQDLKDEVDNKLSKKLYQRLQKKRKNMKSLDDLDKDDIQNMVNRAEIFIKKGEYKKAVNFLEDIESRFERKYKEMYRKIESYNLILDTASNIGVDCDSCEEHLTRAKRSLEEGELSKMRAHLEVAKKILESRSKTKLVKVTRRCLQDVKEMKKKDLDVSEPVKHLRKAVEGCKNEDYLEAIRYIRKFYETTNLSNNRE